MNSLISVIVPIYNVEQYLEKCIKSLINQTYSNIEIILVDDGSTDTSGKICDSWKKMDSRIIVIHKRNGGLSDARNAGIEAASGQWFMFVDSDDYVLETFCEHAVQLVKESYSDIGVFNYQFCWEDRVESSDENVDGLKENKEAMYNLLSGNTKNYAWNKIYKRELFNDVRYPVGKVWEDIGTTYKLFSSAKKVNFSQEVLYCYRQRSVSISYAPPANALFDIYEQYKEQYEFCRIYYPDFMDIVWDNVIGYALICCIKNYSMVREWTNYQSLKDCLRLNHKIPKELSFTKKVMLTIFRISEGLFYKICSVTYFLKSRKHSFMASYLKRYIPVKCKLYVKYILQSKNRFDFQNSKFVYIDFGNYGNAGDNAIGLSTLDFIRKNISVDINYFMVSEFYNNVKMYKRMIKKDTVIILSGGGNLGVKYLEFERIRELICILFKDNPIIIFPQTLDFGDLTNSMNQHILSEAQKIYSKCRDLTICAREKKSYDMINQYFPQNRVILVPDIVLRYRCNNLEHNKNKKVLFCFRKDEEKSIDDYTIKELKKIADNKGYGIEEADTWDKGMIFHNESESREYVMNKIDKFSTAELVLTDRLHGMIFAYLANTPCIVFPNNNHKIAGVFEWISNCGFILLANNLEEADTLWQKYFSEGYKPIDETRISDCDFMELIKLLKIYI